MIPSEQPNSSQRTPTVTFDQRGQTVLGNQTNIAGNVNTTWPRVAIIAAVFALLAFALLFIELATNQVERLSGLSLQALLTIAGLIAAAAWLFALFILRKQRNIGQIIGYDESERERPIYKQVAAFDGWYRRVARVTVWTIPVLIGVVALAYYAWIILPAHYTTILLADFVAPSGVDEALVTQSLDAAISQMLAEFPKLRVKRLHQVIEPDGGSATAQQIGSRPQHKATVVIWGNYAIVAGDPEVHLHFDIVQPADTYLESGFATSYGPGQISQLLKIEQPTMFDFKVSLGTYLGQMSAFTLGLTLYNANRYNDAIIFFETAAQAIDQPLAAKFARSIRFYRGLNYLSLDRAKDAMPDFVALVPNLDNMPVDPDMITLAALDNLGVVAREQGDYRAAQRYLEKSLEFHTELNNPNGRADALNNLGVVAREQGNYPASLQYHKQALAINVQSHDLYGQAIDLGNLGALASVQGEYSAAKQYYEQALALHVTSSDFLGQANQLGNLGSLAMMQGDGVAAKRYLEQALALHTELGHLLGRANELGNLGNLAARQGDSVAAKQYLKQALDLHTELNDLLGQANELGALGLVTFIEGDYIAAMQYLEQALALHTKLDNTLGQTTDLGILGLVAKAQGNYAVARDYLARSAALHQSMGLPLPPELQAALDAQPKDTK